MNNENLISVIIPVYNCETLVEKCILSVVNQTYKNIEIIAVDDGSADNSGKICDRLAEKYNFIKVIHQKNSGVGAARNVGIDNAKGKYLIFVDSDDMIEPKMLEDMLNSACQNNSDIVFDGLKWCDANYNIYRIEMIQIENGVYGKDDIYKKIILPLISCGPKSPLKKPVNNGNCFCLFKADLIKNIRFNTDRSLLIAEDLIFLLYTLKKSTKVSKINGLYYIYYAPFNTDSRSRGSQSTVLEKRLSVMPEIEKFAETYYKNPDDLIYDFIAARYVHEITRCMFTNSIAEKGIKNTYKSICYYINLDEYKDSIKRVYGKQNSFKDRLLLFFIKHRASFFLTMYVSLKGMIRGGSGKNE